MSLRPLRPQSPRRIEWEQLVANNLCNRWECPTSDVQGVLETMAERVDELFEDFIPADHAADILATDGRMQRALTPPTASTELVGRIHSTIAGDSGDDEADLLSEIAGLIDDGSIVFASQACSEEEAQALGFNNAAEAAANAAR